MGNFWNSFRRECRGSSHAEAFSSVERRISLFLFVIGLVFFALLLPGSFNINGDDGPGGGIFSNFSYVFRITHGQVYGPNAQPFSPSSLIDLTVRFGTWLSAIFCAIGSVIFASARSSLCETVVVELSAKATLVCVAVAMRARVNTFIRLGRSHSLR